MSVPAYNRTEEGKDHIKLTVQFLIQNFYIRNYKIFQNEKVFPDFAINSSLAHKIADDMYQLFNNTNLANEIKVEDENSWRLRRSLHANNTILIKRLIINVKILHDVYPKCSINKAIIIFKKLLQIEKIYEGWYESDKERFGKKFIIK